MENLDPLIRAQYDGEELTPEDGVGTNERPRKTTAYESPTDEILHRARRIETRVTQVLNAIGVPTRATPPKFSISAGSAQLHVASPHISLKEILDNIPVSWEGPVGVFVVGELIATIDGLGNRR